MDNKKDIYNLWVQYTTKNDETYFREFVARFVAIWRSQLQLDFQNENCPLWHEVKTDSGPHLGRLPDELLPAIGKFIIVARDECDTKENGLEEQAIEQVAILIECLVIVCRHFDNILAIIKYEYKPNLIAILTKVFKQQLNQHHSTPALSHLFRSFSTFLEVMYDPYLTWRSFVRGQLADYSRLSYKPHAVHVEIVPFIYDCFQEPKLFQFFDIGESLLNILGAVICGSQRNGMRAICPATVSIIMNILQRWESAHSLRCVALNCYALMVIVLQKSSPEERQIDLVTQIQLYCDALQQLMATKHFERDQPNFDIASDENDEDVAIDMAALSSTVAAVKLFLEGESTAVSEAIAETNLLELLTNLPKLIRPWNVSHTNSLCCCMEALATLTRKSTRATEQLRQGDRIERIFSSLQEFDPPSVGLLKACFQLGYNEQEQILLMPEVMLQLLNWLPKLQEQEQLEVSSMVLKGCTDNYGTKSVACGSQVIKAVCECLLQGETLADNCVQNLIKLIEELSKLSIEPAELKKIFAVLRQGPQFPQIKQMQQTLVLIALQSLRGNNTCSEYLAIEQPSDGILVPDIKNWTISGSYGFIFHILVRFQPEKDSSMTQTSKRRMLLTLQTASGGGFEVFVQPNGTVVVAALTRREYLTSCTSTKTLMDGQWHYLTVAITPPKRPFSFSQINIFVDFVQKLSATLKVQAMNEPFTSCSVGAVLATPPPNEVAKGGVMPRSSSQETGSSYKGMLPSLLERTLSANVSNYFTLPLRTQTAFDPNVKNFPIGMQDTVFGEPTCLQGHLGGVLLAEPTTSLKTIFDAGLNFSSIFSQDNDLLELNSRFVFCYAPGAVWHGSCQDLIPGGRYPAKISAQHCKIVKIQETINSIGGINAILPILHRLVQSEPSADISIGSAGGVSEESLSSATPTAEEFNDWEMLSSNSYTEWKMIQHPLASFLCLLRYLTHEHENNQEQLLSSECLAIIGTMLQRCPPSLFDVNALMATHLLMESLQGHKADSGGQLLEALYTYIVFDFAIWSRLQFQITLGHAQYLSAMIKNDRKFFRRRYGVQFMLDVVRQYYTTPDNISHDDAQTIRATLFGIVRFYLQKDVNIKEVNAMVAFLASVRQDVVLVEFLEMMTFYVRGKNCKDQMVLLLHEPQAANLIYNFFVDKSYTVEIQEAAIRFISGLLATSRVHQKYKQVLRLYDQQSEQSMFPGFFSFITPNSLSSTILFHLIDEMLGLQPDYAGVIFLVYHVSSCDLQIKLEIAKRLLQTTFVKQQSTAAIAKQTGWQESIARLLIRKPITSSSPDEEKRRSFGINLDVLLEDNSSFLAQADLITFSDQEIGLAQLQQQQQEEQQSDSGLILNEIQASVSEAATVIESEIKELAETVSGAVVENVNSVFSVLRQTTHDLQDTFESLTQGSSPELNTEPQSPALQRADSLSSESSTPSPQGPTKKSDSMESTSAFDFIPDGDVDTEEQLVYLVSNTLFNIFWRGIANDHPQCWLERGQVLGCINLLALNNELITSHLSLRLRILEMAVQASLFDLSEHGSHTLINQENASHILRMVYELVVLGSNEDESKKCSTKLLDGVLALLDALMIFQQGSSDDWSDMIRLCLGLLLKCSHHPNPGIVAMATAKLHAILQSRSTEDPAELSYLLFSINRALDNAIEVGNPEEYSFLMPVMKALLEKCRSAFNLDATLPDLPSTLSGPVFFNDFQMYSTSKKWRNFIERMVKPLYDRYQRDIELHLWEPINRFWAECYEACKAASKQRASFQATNRRVFQQKIYMPWKVRQVEEMQRLQTAAMQHKTNDSHIRKKWKTAKRFLYGPRGPWFTGEQAEEFWKLSPHENVARMRLKLEPQLYPNKHENAANLRDNATSAYDTKEISEFDSTIKNAVVRDFLADDESSQLEEELRVLMIDTHSQQDVALEKLVMSQECELITLMTKVKGRIEVNQSVFTFVDLSPPSEDGSKHDFGFSINKIREVHLRKYNLRRSALEIFLIDQTSYFLNFTTKTRNKVFTKIVGLPLPNILYGSGRSPAELLRTSGLTLRWMNREISNFEYLMYLNTIAGRSYNDLSQYPVFPWILADYSSDVLDLTDPKSFRDLSKPIGCINPKNEAEVRSKYDSFEDPSGAIPKFHYGTHYSNSAGVLHYLLRVEPFTSLHVELQSGRFDVADRQFHSIPQTWKLLMDNPNDVKELIPEFFYFPEFLKNMNKFDLGHLQITKEKVDDVILPAWANTPEEFIAIHRRALESEYVSQHLHHWIDLIFGYKQKGPKAAEALNVFYYCSYEGAVDLDKITNLVEREAVEGMINNFGQVPSQLLREPHPRRLTQDETALKLVRAELRRPDLTQFLDKVVQYYCELSTPKDPIVYLSPPRSPPRSFLQLSPDVLVSVSKSAILGCNSWLSFDKEQGFLLEIDATTANLKNRKRIFGPFHSSQPTHSQLFAVSTDGKLLYAGGIWDNSLRVYNLNKGKAMASVTRHLDIITCLALDNCGSYLVTGSRDCTCIVWSIQANQQGGGQSSNIPVHALTGQSHLQAITQLNTQNSYSPKPRTVLYGHDKAISSVAIYTELDLVVSGSLDGTVNVYTLQEGQFVRTLKPIGCTESCVQISYVTVSYHGHIAFSALDDTSHSVHVYSINGSSLGSKYVSGRVTGLACASDFLVVADDAGDITMSRLHGLKPIFDIPLHVPIQTVVVTPGNTHILAPLRDGRLAVVAVQLPTGGNKKHSVLNV